MAHMQNDITEKMLGWRVETHDAGTCFVPEHVVAVPAYLAQGVELARADDPDVFELLAARVKDYVEGREILSLEVCKGYFARLSAPGYLDCTEWSCYKTLREARASLREYGE